MSEPDRWIEDWLSRPRFAVYLADADGDPTLALARYGVPLRSMSPGAK
ncbi:hypothetical protein [Pseudonocardia sp. UM4_GMWB1]